MICVFTSRERMFFNITLLFSNNYAIVCVGVNVLIRFGSRRSDGGGLYSGCLVSCCCYNNNGKIFQFGAFGFPTLARDKNLWIEARMEFFHD